MEGGVFFLAGTFSFREGETVSLRDTAINAMVQRVCKGLMIESALWMFGATSLQFLAVVDLLDRWIYLEFQRFLSDF